MGRRLSHADAAELLGAYALDALGPGDREAVERHLAACAPCRAEVAGHREVVALLTAGLERPPEDLWDRIAGSLEEAPPPLDLSPVRAMKPGRGRWGVRAAALVAAAAAAVIGLLGYKVVDDGRRIDRISAGVHSEELQRTINAAMVDPQAAKVELRSTDGLLFADAWMLPDGRGYLARHNLPTLAPDRTYQLWALVGASRISVGVLGPGPGPSAFRATGPGSGLAVTEEAAGGAVATERQPLVVGKVGG